jgi:hypothetical protein
MWAVQQTLSPLIGTSDQDCFYEGQHHATRHISIASWLLFRVSAFGYSIFWATRIQCALTSGASTRPILLLLGQLSSGKGAE